VTTATGHRADGDRAVALVVLAVGGCGSGGDVGGGRVSGHDEKARRRRLLPAAAARAATAQASRNLQSAGHGLAAAAAAGDDRSLDGGQTAAAATAAARAARPRLPTTLKQASVTRQSHSAPRRSAARDARSVTATTAGACHCHPPGTDGAGRRGRADTETAADEHVTGDDGDDRADVRGQEQEYGISVTVRR